MGGKDKWEMGEGVQEEEKWGWYLPTLMACDRVSCYILHIYDNVHMYHSNSQITR